MVVPPLVRRIVVDIGKATIVGIAAIKRIRLVLEILLVFIFYTENLDVFQTVAKFSVSHKMYWDF